MQHSILKNELEQEVVGQCVCQKVRKAARTVTRAYDEALKPVGIKANQFTMLSVIALVDDLSLTSLADKIGMERTTLIRNLGPLERDGLVEIYAQPGSRARSAKITEQGQYLIKEALPLWRKAQSSLKQYLGDEMWASMQTNLHGLGSAPIK